MLTITEEGKKRFGKYSDILNELSDYEKPVKVFNYEELKELIFELIDYIQEIEDKTCLEGSFSDE